MPVWSKRRRRGGYLLISGAAVMATPQAAKLIAVALGVTFGVTLAALLALLGWWTPPAAKE